MQSKAFVPLAIVALLGLGSSAFAQSLTAPAGRDPATAPGGTEGLAGPANEREAMDSGVAKPTAPGAGIKVDTPPSSQMERTEEPATKPRQ